MFSLGERMIKLSNYLLIYQLLLTFIANSCARVYISGLIINVEIVYDKAFS